MIRRYLVTAVLCCFVWIAAAQKIDGRLLRLLPQTYAKGKAAPEAREPIDTAAVRKVINVSFNSDGSVRSFSAFAMLREGAACPREQFRELGIEIRQRFGRMLVLNVPAAGLTALDDIDEVESVGADEALQLLNDSVRSKSRVVEVSTWEKAAAHDLPQAYTGQGVLVGIIDEGIDYNHAAFRNADGTTRVKYVINHINSAMHNDYTDPEDIALLTTDNKNESHGTHTSSTAAGSRVEGLDRQGIAPEADLMLCGLGATFFSSTITQAIRMMFDYADEHEQPCVINISIGDMTGFHDGMGSDVLYAIREMYKEVTPKGRILVFGAGNNAGFHGAIMATMPDADAEGYGLRSVLGQSDTVTRDGQEVNAYKSFVLNFYNTDGSELDVDAKAVDVTTGEVYTLEEKPLYRSSMTTSQLFKSNTVHYLNNKHFVHFSLDFTSWFKEPNLKLAFFVKSPKGKTLRAIDRRTGSMTGFRSEGLEGYTEGGDNGAFSIYVCGDEVISVGGYVSRAEWTSIDGSTMSFENPWDMVDDGIASFSSWGEEDESGIVRPDVIAPCTAVLSGYNLYDRNFFRDGEIIEGTEKHITDKAALFGRNNYYGAMHGTSMAVPNVTGTIALWLQAKPDLTYDEVRSVIRETSRNDRFTTNPDLIPSHDVRQAGMGKIDALAGLQLLTGATGIDVARSDESRAATPATMIGLNAPVHNVLGQRVRPKTKGLVIYKGRKYVNR